jgi:hypothetical protein
MGNINLIIYCKSDFKNNLFRIPVAELKAWLGVHSLAAAGLEMAARSLYRDFSSVGNIGRSINNAWPHPEFDPSTFINDIAVLELRFPVRVSSRIYPICLPAKEKPDQYARQLATVAGWGRIGEKKPPSDVPRQASVEVWSDDQCQNSGYPKTRLRGPVLCAGRLSGGLDACQVSIFYKPSMSNSIESMFKISG